MGKEYQKISVEPLHDIRRISANSVWVESIEPRKQEEILKALRTDGGVFLRNEEYGTELFVDAEADLLDALTAILAPPETWEEP